jgi:tRNA pseudouridine13 synthase
LLTFTPTIDTFLVEEIAAYAPSGAGEHTYLWIEKKGLTTFEAVRRLAGMCDVDPRDVGYAGMKDRHATTRQWISVPRLDPERAVEISFEGMRVLEARRHGNKLRTGHLNGNRFEAVLTGADDGDLPRVERRLTEMARAGLPNRYGEQRFGAAGDNAAQGLALLRGERRERDHRRRRLLMSAAQSAVFNGYLDLRADNDALARVRGGDVLQKTDTGGLFVCVEPAIDQARVQAGEIVPTGPMPGTRVMEPPPDSESGVLEQRALGVIGATREDFARGGRDLPGARRPVIVMVEVGDAPVAREASSVSPPSAGALRVKFSLPAGSYATVVIDSLLSFPASVDADNLC